MSKHFYIPAGQTFGSCKTHLYVSVFICVELWVKESGFVEIFTNFHRLFNGLAVCSLWTCLG